ncbi:MAG: hypothetical protein KatS3mg021_2670 [Fimbriimonadales bacterium]|nr:MAG: hypothetical protein KatS3mg021_2670 [Fimbriimonadales bacterium]
MQEVVERYAPRFAVLSGVSLLMVLMAWLGMGLRMLERMQHPNALSRCTEAYLHACQYQLVNWREWRAETFAEAQKLDRLVFVEVGAYWSGRAKRLGRELFQDSGVADLLNREFIPVKVDADAAPKRARYLQQVAELFNLPMRYPLIAIFTPDGKPIAALAPETRAELMRVLEETSKNYRTRPEEVRLTAETLARAWEQRWIRASFSVDHGALAEPEIPPLPTTPEAWFGGQPQLLNVLEWLLSRAESDAAARSRLIETLHALRASPLWDPGKGGFFALAEGLDYEQKPIGGKRLMEHARLLRLYTRASQYDPELALVAHELAASMRTLFWSERPAGFSNTTQPPSVVRALAQEPQALKVDRTFVTENNALAVLALVEYATHFGDSASLSRWAREAAQSTIETLRAMRTVEGHLYHTSRHQTAEWLRDLALTLQAGCAVERLQPDPSRKRWLRQLVALLDAYKDPAGGYYDSPHTREWGGWSLAPVRVCRDEELPADNVLVAQALLAWSHLTGSRTHAQQAEQTLSIIAGDYDPQNPLKSLSLFALRNQLRHEKATAGTH